ASHHGARRRARARAQQSVREPFGRGQPRGGAPAGRRPPPARRPGVRLLSAARGAAPARSRAALRWRASDAGDRHGFDVRAAVAGRSSNTTAHAAGMAELELRGLHLAFGGLKVLESVSFAVEAGELLALIGPNGAGKTSVLNCVCGIYRPIRGEVFFGGERITGEPPHTIARRGIARTFQHGELLPHLSVLDNLLVGRHIRLQGGFLSQALFLPSARAAERVQREAVERILEFVELERYRHQPVGTLGFGTQKIVGFARALALEPKVL